MRCSTQATRKLKFFSLGKDAGFIEHDKTKQIVCIIIINLQEFD